MNILYMIIMILGAIIGIGSTLVIIVMLFGTIGQKIYRKVKYGISMFE